MSAYREQYDRMRRWYDRFSALNSGRQHDVPSDIYVDDIYAFFLNAYHLKDWIKNDTAVRAHVQQSVEKYIDSSTHLALCADICNSLKHLTLKKPPRCGHNPSFGRKKFALELGQGPAVISLRYEISTAPGASIDAIELASECVKAWDHFLHVNNI